MKNSSSLILVLLISSISFFSCKKDKDEKDSINANFTVSNVDKGGIQITINEYTSDGSYVIDFGDGTKKAYSSNFSGSLKYYYKTAGTYNITVSVTKSSSSANDSKSNSTTISSVPTQVKIKYIKLKNFPSTNPNNSQPWDGDATGPDLQFYYQDYTTTETDVINNTPYINASTGILPIQLNIDTLFFPLSSQSIAIICRDYDSPSSSEVVGAIFFNVNESSREFLSGDSNLLYPSTATDEYFEIGLDWVP